MHLRRLDSVDQTQPIAPQELIDYEKPNFFASTSTSFSSTEGALPEEKDIDSNTNDNANRGGGGAKATSTGVAVGLVAFLYILMMICKNRSRRDFASGSGQRSIHHRGNKRKIAPAPAQTPEPPAQRPNDAVTDNNNGEDDISGTDGNNNGNANVNAIDEEQPPMSEEEEQHDNGVDNIESSTVTAIAFGALPTIPE